MDLTNLENYPVYILNVVPELSEETNVQIPQQITSNESLTYNYYAPDVQHQIPILNTDNVSPVSQKSNTKLGKSSYEKLLHNTVKNNSQTYETNSNNLSKKSINDLSLLLKDEDINNASNKVLKYDAKTDTNVIFHLVRPSDLEVNPIEIKVPKRGRPRKNVSESNSEINQTKQNQSSKLFKPEDIVEYPLTSTKSGRLCKPPKHLLNEEKTSEVKNNSFLITDYNDVISRKKVKYSIKSDYVCGGCSKTYLGHKRMQEHLEKFPSHKINTNKQQVNLKLQDIFQNLQETPINIDIINSKKESHTQTELAKDRHCGYMKSKKNLAFHLKQIIKQIKKSSLVKSLSGTISAWDLLFSTLENGNLQTFSKELNTLIINLKSISKSLKLILKCDSTSVDNQMFIDDSLSHLFGLPKGSYGLQNVQNEYEIEEASNVWTLDSTKNLEPKVSTSQDLNHHPSPIHLNIFDNQSSKVDFLLSTSMEESIMCDENQAALESVDGLVTERLCTMSDHLHSNVPIIDYPIASTSSNTNVSQSHSFMGHGVYEVFTNDLNLVPTTTEEFIKSLEQFEPLNDSDNTLNTETRMLDFEDLQHTFNTT